MGSTGPTGPASFTPDFASIAIGYGTSGVTVAQNAAIPFATANPTASGTNISVTSGTIEIGTTGYYQITWGVSPAPSLGQYSLQLNGTTVAFGPNLAVIDYNTSGLMSADTTMISQTIIAVVDTPNSSLQVINSSNTSLTLQTGSGSMSNNAPVAFVTIVKISN